MKINNDKNIETPFGPVPIGFIQPFACIEGASCRRDGEICAHLRSGEYCAKHKVPAFRVEECDDFASV